ncbi:unnamed protein product [Calypogeia fissa]
MTMPSNPTSAVPTPRALAQQRYNQALELEKQLRALLQSKAPFDPSVRALRNRICESYEAVILEDHEFAESHEVEQAIWRLHYKCIEEFRARLRKSTAAAAAAASAPVIPMPGARLPPARRDTSQKILSVFKSFLSEATGFYHNLILKLRAKHGLPQNYSPFEAEPSGLARDDKRAAELKSCDLSCHRCLIFLGDLARYKESHGEADVRSRDWSVAAGYYQQAISLWPSSGNPHNQLAVLATYVSDELLAVYRYFRSLAVENPFLTARDNLIILFEKNRNHYAQLPPQETAVSSSKPDSGKPSEKGKPVRGDRILPVGDGALKLAVKDRNLEGADIGEIRKSFRIRFVRLNGILFTKTSLETFAEVYSATVCELETLLSPDDASLEAGLGSDHRSGIGTGSSGAAGFLQLVSILIFTVHNINWGPDSHHPTYAEILQRSALFQHAFTAAFECAGRLMRRCADSMDISKSPLLPAMLVFLEWLACRPEMAAGSDVDEKQANARAFFWRQSVILLNCCSEAMSKVPADGGLEGALQSLSAFGDEDSLGGVALWEDYELRGFVSIVPAQLTLDYSKRAPRTGLGDKKERDVRVQRLLAAGKAIANALEGTDKGIIYDEDGKKFFMACGRPQKKVHDRDESAVLDDISILPGEIVDESEGLTGAAWLKDSVGTNSSLLPSNVAVHRREEEDEEVIVFKPMIKDSQALTTAPEAAWKDLVGVEATSNNSGLGPNFGDHRGQDAVRKTLLANHLDMDRSRGAADVKKFANDLPTGPAQANGLMLPSQGANSATFVNNHSETAGSIPSLMPSVSGAHALMKDEEIGVGKTTYGYAPSSAADWLNHVGRSTAGFPAATLPWDVHSVANLFGNSSEKSPVTGVIGQPKQAVASNSLWSTSLDSLTTVAGLSNLTLGNSDYSLRHNGPLGGALPHSNMSLDSLIQASVKDTSGASQTAFSAPPTANGTLYSGDLHRNNVHNGAVGRPYAQNPSSYLAGKSSASVETQSEKSLPFLNKQSSVANGTAASPSPSTGVTTKDTAVPPARASGMRPPPGFGPLPTKTTSSSVAVTTQQSSSQPQKSPRGNEVEEHHQVDDYRWLDDYSHKGNIGQIGYYQGQSSSLYSSDYGIWSNGGMSEPVPLSKAPTTYPFPGMGISEQEQLENQRQQYNAQLLQQLLQPKQKYDSPRVDYGVEQPPAHWINNNGLSAQQYEAQQQYQQQLLLLQQQQQQQQPQHHQQQPQPQQLWYGQYQSRDPFVS